MWPDCGRVSFLPATVSTHSELQDNCCVKYNISLTEGKEGGFPVGLWLTLHHTGSSLHLRDTEWSNSDSQKKRQRIEWCSENDLELALVACSWPHLLTIILPPLNFSPTFHPAGGFLPGAAGCQRRDQRLGFGARPQGWLTYKHT